MENNELIKYEGGLIKRVGNAISVTNKLDLSPFVKGWQQWNIMENMVS